MSEFLKRHGYRNLRMGKASILVDPRIVLACAMMAIVLAVIAAASLSAGSFHLALPDLARAVFDPQAVGTEQRHVVWDIRLPRIAMALLCGAMLGLSGAAMQSITRNGLADPGLIGVKEGAAVMVLSLVILAPQVGIVWRPLVGMIGGLVTATIVVVIARDMSRVRFILIGIGVSWLFSAAIAIFMTTANIRDVQTALIWLSGSLHAATWPLVIIASIWGCIGAIVLFATARASDVALLGNHTATGLGVNLPVLAFLRFLAPVVLTAASVSCVGSLGFVGLVAPHIARFLIGGNQMALLVSSALSGAALVFLADTIGRLAFAPLQIPAGIVMSMLGVPFFLILLWRRRDQL
ncbi:iron ABC transporter permease [Rhizobium sp. 2MFCol3.1]|uniref:FecCD family ABC transporter permease n=1 Tax=Rhizobium sp. 2MFCol3.1 TaxID=1246459 RepID=UPI0003652AE8|nr:iron ABC transporter permease [Rhizobium sp. 2MFCol3.1]